MGRDAKIIKHEWEAMSPRERDAAVAERVIGLRYCVEDYTMREETVKRRVWRDHEGHAVYIGDDDVPRFSEDAGRDYLVLEHVRAKWDRERRIDFEEWVGLITFKRNTDKTIGKPWLLANVLANYRPGDYSHAALLVTDPPPSPS